MLDKYINSTIFIVAFAISMIVVYFMQPEPVVVYKFPNPDNAGKLTYQDDKSKNCYKYEATQVKCPSDPNLILEHPIIIK
jgi:hypothetical protein